MKIEPASALADLIRMMYKLKMLSMDEADKAIDHIQHLVFQHEIDLKDLRKLKQEGLL